MEGAEFDRDLEKETDHHIQQLRQEMKLDLEEKLKEQRNEAAQTLSLLDNVYQTCHNALAASIFDQIIKE